VTNLDDLHALRAAAASSIKGSIEGVIVGRALYDGAFDVAAGLNALSGEGA